MGRRQRRFDKEGIDMMEIERPKIETASLSPDGRYGRFVATPYGAYGYTLPFLLFYCFLIFGCQPLLLLGNGEMTVV